MLTGIAAGAQLSDVGVATNFEPGRSATAYKGVVWELNHVDLAVPIRLMNSQSWDSLAI
jgi:hypothetical protein